jgi:hypothetical protein
MKHPISNTHLFMCFMQDNVLIMQDSRILILEGVMILMCSSLHKPFIRVGMNQPVHWFLGGKGLGIQQEMSVWVGSPKSFISRHHALSQSLICVGEI